jgi:predicted phage-related endonuclease
MVKCKSGECPKGTSESCCFSCGSKETCDEVCSLNHETCGDAEVIEDGENQVQIFQDTNVAALRKIADILTTKKKLEEQEKELKEMLKQGMEARGIKSFNNDILKITYVASTSATTVDSKKLKDKHPGIYEECSKVSSKSAYVKVEVE